MLRKKKLTFGMAGLTLCGIWLAALSVAYYRSCLNAGTTLSPESFLEGVLVKTSNCGGNSVALSVCEGIALTAAMNADDHQGTFDPATLSQDEKAEIVRDAKNDWIAGADFLLRKTPVMFDKGHRQILVVCTHTYGNVPKPSFWNLHRRNPAHAVGYDDGSTGLISPADFAALDRPAFLDAANLLTNEHSTSAEP